jgi:hypothetical protein
VGCALNLTIGTLNSDQTICLLRTCSWSYGEGYPRREKMYGKSFRKFDGDGLMETTSSCHLCQYWLRDLRSCFEYCRETIHTKTRRNAIQFPDVRFVVVVLRYSGCSAVLIALGNTVCLDARHEYLWPSFSKPWILGRCPSNDMHARFSVVLVKQTPNHSDLTNCQATHRSTSHDFGSWASIIHDEGFICIVVSTIWCRTTSRPMESSCARNDLQSNWV